MAQSSEEAPYEIVGLTMSLPTRLKRVGQRSAESSWFSPGALVSLLQGKLAEWIRIKTVKKVITTVVKIK